MRAPAVELAPQSMAGEVHRWILRETVWALNPLNRPVAWAGDFGVATGGGVWVAIRNNFEGK